MIRQWPTALCRSVRNSGNFILFLISKHFQRQFSLYLDFEPNETCSFVSFIRQSKHLVYTLIGIITFSKEVNIANKRCVRMDDSEQLLSPLILTENICVQGIRWIMHMRPAGTSKESDKCDLSKNSEIAPLTLGSMDKSFFYHLFCVTQETYLSKDLWKIYI